MKSNERVTIKLRREHSFS